MSETIVDQEIVTNPNDYSTRWKKAKLLKVDANCKVGIYVDDNGRFYAKVCGKIKKFPTVKAAEKALGKEKSGLDCVSGIIYDEEDEVAEIIDIVSAEKHRMKTRSGREYSYCELILTKDQSLVQAINAYSLKRKAVIRQLDCELFDLLKDFKVANASYVGEILKGEITVDVLATYGDKNHDPRKAKEEW